MAPRTRTRSREGTASSGERVTRSRARSNASRESSAAPETEGGRPIGAAKPDVKSEVSLAYGSPQRNKVPNRLVSMIRERNIEGAIGEAVDTSANVVVEEDDFELSDIEETEAEDDDETTVQISSGRQFTADQQSTSLSQLSTNAGVEFAAGQQSMSFNLERPVGRSASVDSDGFPKKKTSDRLSSRNLRKIDRESSAESDEYVERMIYQIPPSYVEGNASRFGNLTKLLLASSVLALSLLALYAQDGISSAASHIGHNLKAQADSILTPPAANPFGNWTQDMVSNWKQDMTSQVNAIANSVRHLTSRLDKLDSRADAMNRAMRPIIHVTNHEEVLDLGINAFAVGSGLLVDPYRTSPTKRVQEKVWLGPLFRAFLGAPITQPRTPYAAFQPWEDYGDCWCAAASDGHAQLSVILPRGVSARTLVIEHISDHRTPDPGATPKDFELWAKVDDDAQREWAEVIVRNEYGEPRERHEGLPALDDKWIRVLVDRYEGRSSRRAQTFNLPEHLVFDNNGGIHSRHFTLRIHSVWGDSGDHACLYRVKLFGDNPNDGEIDSTI